MPKNIDNLNNAINGYSDFIFEKLGEYGFGITNINPESIENYDSLKNKIISGFDGNTNGIIMPAMAIFFNSCDYDFFEIGSSEKLKTTINVGIQLFTISESQARQIMDIIARETMSMDIEVKRPDEQYAYRLFKETAGFALIAEEETLFFGESIGIKVYSATTDIVSVI